MSASVAPSPAPSAPPAPPPSPPPAQTRPAPPPPEPRPAVTAVVPPSSSASPRTPLAGGPKLEPAQIVPPAPAPNAPAPEPARSQTGSALAPSAIPAPTPAAPAPVAAVPPPALASTLASAGLSPEALRRAVASAVQESDCAVVSGDLSRSGLLSLRGVIGGGEPVQALLRRVRDAAPNAALDWAMDEASGPYCGALNLVRAYARPFGAETGGMELGLKDGRTSLVADDKIDIRTTLPAFPAYLQVDYFSTDGSVSHLRTAAAGSPPLPARSSQSFVAGEVAIPFGTDLIVSIASSTPLFAKGQSLAETVDAYVRELRTALDAAARRRSDLAAGVLLVRTGPKS